MTWVTEITYFRTITVVIILGLRRKQWSVVTAHYRLMYKLNYETLCYVIILCCLLFSTVFFYTSLYTNRRHGCQLTEHPYQKFQGVPPCPPLALSRSKLLEEVLCQVSYGINYCRLLFTSFKVFDPVARSVRGSLISFLLLSRLGCF